MVEKMIFLECDIPRKDNGVGSRIICLVGFLTKGVTYKNENVSSGMELWSVVLESGCKTQAYKRFKV